MNHASPSSTSPLPLLPMVSIGMAAACLTLATLFAMSVLDSTPQVQPPQLAYRTVDVVQWTPPKPQPPPPKPRRPLQSKPLPQRSPAKPKPPTSTRTAAKPRVRSTPALPLKIDFHLPLPAPDLALAFTPGNSTAELPELLQAAGSPAPETEPLPPPKQLYRQSELDHAPTPLAPLSPAYPRSAQMRGLEGSVSLLFTVTAHGTTSDIHIETPSRHGALNRAAVEAIRTWRFVPGRKDGRDVASLMTITVNFKLER